MVTRPTIPDGDACLLRLLSQLDCRRHHVLATDDADQETRRSRRSLEGVGTRRDYRRQQRFAFRWLAAWCSKPRLASCTSRSPTCCVEGREWKAEAKAEAGTGGRRYRRRRGRIRERRPRVIDGVVQSKGNSDGDRGEGRAWPRRSDSARGVGSPATLGVLHRCTIGQGRPAILSPDRRRSAKSCPSGLSTCREVASRSMHMNPGIHSSTRVYGSYRPEKKKRSCDPA